MLTGMVSMIMVVMLLACSGQAQPEPTQNPAAEGPETTATHSERGEIQAIGPETANLSPAVEMPFPTDDPEPPLPPAPATGNGNGTGTATATDPTPIPQPDPTPSRPASDALRDVDPDIAAPIRALPWAEDGVTADEESLVDALAHLGGMAPRIFETLLAKPWMSQNADDPNEARLQLIRTLSQMADTDETVALQVMELPFLDSVEPGDVRYAWFLMNMLWADSAGLEGLISHPTILAGGASSLAENVPLLYLDLKDPEAATLVRELPWVKDGITYWEPTNSFSPHDDPAGSELGVVEDLIGLLRWNRAVFLALVEQPWMQGPISQNVRQVLFPIKDLSNRVPESAIKVMDMPFLDEVDYKDRAVLSLLAELYWEDRSYVVQLVDRLESQGGLTDENHFPVYAIELELLNPQAWERVHALPWVEDGVEGAEQDGARALIFAALETKMVFSALMEKHWVKDGLTRSETSAIWNLGTMGSPSYYAGNPDPVVATLLDMPFLESVGEADAAALRTMSYLLGEGEGEAGHLPEVLAQPTLEGGITDEDAVLLAVLRPTATYHAESMAEQLNAGDNWGVHRRVELPSSGPVHLAVYGTGEGRGDTLDLLEDTVRAMEEFMIEPLPVRFIGLMVTDWGAGYSPYGTNTIRPEKSRDQGLMAHLLSYTYWATHIEWIYEGSATLLSRFVTTDPAAFAESPSSLRCDIAKNIGELEQLEEEWTFDNTVRVRGSDCHRDLPLGLYLDLYNSLGDEAFREGFRGVYLELAKDGLNQICYIPQRGLCLLRQGFVINAFPANAAIAEEIIDRWYYGDPFGKDN